MTSDTPEPVSWNSLFETEFDKLRDMYAKHMSILTAGIKADIGSIAHLHARDLLPEVEQGADLLQVLNYIDMMLEEEKIDPLTVEEIHDTNGDAPCFQRLKTDKRTVKSYKDEGLLIESARFYPSGTVVRTFHSVFRDAGAWQKATQGQEFYAALVAHIDETLNSKTVLSDDEQYLADRIAKAAPIRPLHSEGQVLDNVFVNGTDVQDSFKRDDPSIGDRVSILSEITDIDLITGFYSADFRKKGEGKRHYTTGRIFKKKLFEPQDYRKDVFEKILLRADKDLFKELAANGIITTDGKVFDEKAFAVFYSGDDDRAKVLDLIGVNADNLEQQVCFTPHDLNLGNVMVTEEGGERKYTHIDFERSREDSLEYMLFRRWVQSGIYDHDGSSKALEDGSDAETILLDKAFSTIDTLCRVNGEEAPSREMFQQRFNIHKKKHLLNLARIYRSMESRTKHNPEELGSYKRFFYTLFARELEKEGKILGLDDDQLTYLNALFEQPLPEEEMKRIADTHNPGFTAQEEISPLDVKDVASRNKDLIEKYKAAKAAHKMKQRATWAAAAVLTIAAAVGGVWGYKELELSEVERLRNRRNYTLSLSEQHLRMIDSGRNNTLSKMTEYNLMEYARRFGDEMTARAAVVDHIAVYEAIEETGSTSWGRVRGYLYDHGYADVIFAANPDTYVDSFMWQGGPGANEKSARQNVDREWAEAKRVYDARKAAERNQARSDCVIIPSIGSWNTKTGEASMSYDCVPLHDWRPDSDEILHLDVEPSDER